MSILRVVKKFRTILSGHQKLRIFELAILMLIGGFLEMCSVSLVLPFMNAVMNPEETMEMWYVKLVCELLNLHSPRTFLVILAIALAGLYILKNMYLLFEFNVQYRFVYGNMLNMQNRLLENIVHRPYEFFLGVSSGEIIRIVNQDTPSTFNLLLTLLSLFTELVVSLMLVFVIFIVTPFVSLCMAVALLLMLLVVSRIIKPVLRRAGQENQSSGAGMNKWLLQSIQGIKELKIMGKERYFLANYASHGRVYVRSLRKYQLLGVAPRFLIEAISMSTMFIVIAALIYRGSKLETIVPMLSAVAMAAIRLLPSVNRISSSVASISYSEPMLDKLIENLREIEGADQVSLGNELKSTPKNEEKGNIASIHHKIDFQDISYRYPGSETDVLSSASMVIRHGESVGVVGSSGSGKTTAIDILLGLLCPQKGQVLIDGADISSDIRGWHDQIGYIPQMIFMLDDTIRNNVCFGEKEERISDEKVWQALEEASLADFVRSLPEGLNTEIGERGVRLSGGQRQRIGIARALYGDPAVLVFDEATSALDNETEGEIMESIRRLQGQKTMIIIAHRLTTIENCDHIYRVENGTIHRER